MDNVIADCSWLSMNDYSTLVSSFENYTQLICKYTTKHDLDENLFIDINRPVEYFDRIDAPWFYKVFQHILPSFKFIVEITKLKLEAFVYVYGFRYVISIFVNEEFVFRASLELAKDGEDILCNIHTLYTDEKYRQKGICSDFIKAIMKFSKITQVDSVQNKHLKKWLYKTGFTIRKDLYCRVSSSEKLSIMLIEQYNSGKDMIIINKIKEDK